MFCLRLRGIGVALSAEAEIGQFRTDRVCQNGHKHVKNFCPRWDGSLPPQDYGADALPTEPQLLTIILPIIAECDRNAVMRFTANKNVALSASAQGLSLKKFNCMRNECRDL